MVEEIRGYAEGFVFGHVGIQIENIDYLICVQGAKSNKTLPSGVISQWVSNLFRLIERIDYNGTAKVHSKRSVPGRKMIIS